MLGLVSGHAAGNDVNPTFRPAAPFSPTPAPTFAAYLPEHGRRRFFVADIREKWKNIDTGVYIVASPRKRYILHSSRQAPGKGAFMSQRDEKMVKMANDLLKVDADILSSIVIIIKKDRSVDLKAALNGEPTPEVLYFLNQISQLFRNDNGTNQAPYVANRLPV